MLDTPLLENVKNAERYAERFQRGSHDTRARYVSRPRNADARRRAPSNDATTGSDSHRSLSNFTMSQQTLVLPPVLSHDRPLVEAASGGAENEWVKYDKVKEYTNAFVILDDKKVGRHH